MGKEEGKAECHGSNLHVTLCVKSSLCSVRKIRRGEIGDRSAESSGSGD